MKSCPFTPRVLQPGRGGLIDPSEAFRYMSVAKPLLLIPVENQVRELDPKLLLACIAARRGFSSIIGSRREMDRRECILLGSNTIIRYRRGCAVGG